ncbi:MAG: AsmA family protein, partial [Comamonadaceae bacterium]
PLQFKARAGSVQAEAEGILANPAALSGLDFQVALKASSMADLYELTGIVLPNTPPFQTRGRLVGSLVPESATWEYRDFRGSVGESDLQGSLAYTSAKPRPQLKGTMTSRQLRLADLGPIVGAPTGEGAQEKGTSKRPGKVLPDSAFATDRWNAMDLDLTFTGERIVRPDSLPIENLSVHAKLQNAELTLAPLRFGVAQGKIDSRLVLDARDGPLKTQLRGSVEGLRLAALFPKVELMEKSFGRLDGAVALSATGNSIARMLGSSSGEARLYIRDGTFSKQMLDLAALNVGSVVVSRMYRRASPELLPSMRATELPVADSATAPSRRPKLFSISSTLG